jgi:EpsI family protein
MAASSMMGPLRVALSGALLVGALLVLQLRSSGEAVPIRKPLDAFPSSIGAWQGREGMILEPDILGVLKSTDYVMRQYRDAEGQTLWLFIAYWDSQRKGAQPHSPRNCLPGAGWEPLEAGQVAISLPAPQAPIRVNRYLIQKDRDQQVVFYWYQSQGKAIAGEVAARVQMVESSIMRHRTDGALVRVSGPVRESERETTDDLVRYIQAMYPLLGQYLPD